MKRTTLFGISFIIFVLGDNVLEMVGWRHRDFTSLFIYRVYPLFYIVLGLIAYYFMIGKITVADLLFRMKNELAYLSICFGIVIYGQITKNSNPMSWFLDSLVIPCIILIFLRITDKKILFDFRKWIYIFFFLNAGIAVIEKVFSRLLFLKDSPWFFDYFRSTALFGHPLNNALIMSVLTIILFLATKETYLKMGVLLAGMLSIFCFGARGALLGVFGAILLNIILNGLGFTKEPSRNIKSGLMYLASFALILIVVISFTNLGDRIAGLAHVDESAEARVGSFDILQQVDLKDLMWTGVSLDKIDMLQYLSGVEIIENFYIEWLLNFGLVVTVVLIISLIMFLYNMMHNIGADIKFPILFTLIAVSSSNNSLATSTYVITILVMAYYIFLDFRVLVLHKVPTDDLVI
ncbi:VpsF family polysaccharide biosynthesis protein [Pedobacter arcticus]|uniref:VpsF family polysaccharide biosynthesis protein n=1 Tax=Pedobacter arcticus TaxID=752140 RepID=UPI0012B678A7|nr:VpsF family polysaccharide biosynthesis protein [Pedobacter arcticus]